MDMDMDMDWTGCENDLASTNHRTHCMHPAGRCRSAAARLMEGWMDKQS